MAILLVFSSSLPALGATSMILFGSRTEVWLVTTLGVIVEKGQLEGGILLFGKTMRSVLALSAIALTTMLLYRYGPRRPQQWRSLWPGSLVAATLWFGATTGFAWYVRNIANYNLLYGSIGAVIALTLWMYLLAVITLFGCAYNAERERLEMAVNSVEMEPPPSEVSQD